MKEAQPVEIVKNKLYAFKYEKRKHDILYELLSLWNDTKYLVRFYEQNKKYFQTGEIFPYGYSVEDFVEDIGDAVEELESYIITLKEKNIDLSCSFIPLDNKESKILTLSLRKNKYRILRVYALKIEDNLYIITGGAIKITKTIQEHKCTKSELARMSYVRDYLKSIDVKTEESFYCYYSI